MRNDEFKGYFFHIASSLILLTCNKRFKYLYNFVRTQMHFMISRLQIREVKLKLSQRPIISLVW